MADQNHLDWLREGMKAWNSRRASNDFDPDLSGADLTGTDLRDFNLAKANLEKANLRNINLFGTVLKGSNLAQADLRKVIAPMTRFDDAILFGAELQEAELSGADFTNAILQRANLTNADLSWGEPYRRRPPVRRGLWCTPRRSYPGPHQYAMRESLASSALPGTLRTHRYSTASRADNRVGVGPDSGNPQARYGSPIVLPRGAAVRVETNTVGIPSGPR